MRNTIENSLSGNNSTLQAAFASRNEAELVNTSNFLGHEINVYGSIECPLFLAKDVAEWIEHSDVSTMIRNVDEDEKLIQTLFVSGQNRDCFFLTEDGLYEVLMQSRKPIAKQFKKGVKTILKSIRKTGEFSVKQKPAKGPSLTSQVTAGVKWVKEVSKLLKLNDVSKLQLLEKVGEPLGLPVPDYVQSKGVLKSATELLAEYGIALTAHQFNDVAIDKGFMEKIERTSSKGKKKKFNSITTKGLEYGENLVNRKNANETQPKWYVSRFSELVSVLGLSKEMEVSHAN